MQKIIYISFIYLICSGCAISTNVERTRVVNLERENQASFLDKVKDQNLTNEGFFVQKAQIEVTTDSRSENFNATIKFASPDSFLISIRSKTGIEAARIFLDNDTVLINDRLNRQLLYGNPVGIERKYGISNEILPLIFGDLIGEIGSKEGNLNCNNNVFEQLIVNKGIRLNYVFDCKRSKILSVVKEGAVKGEETKVEFDDFVLLNNKLYPTKILLSYKSFFITITIAKLEAPWYGSIEFIPGNNYELVELL